MHGGQHRVKTLGHDPILGWVFGVANIISDTITICPEYEIGEKKFRIPYVESYNVDMGSNFCWKEQTPAWNIFKNSFESIGSEIFSGCTALKEIVIPQGSSDFFEEELFPISRELLVEKDS